MAQVARLSRTPAVGLQHWDRLITGVPKMRSARAALTWPPVTTKKPKTRLHAFHRWREPKSHPRIVRIMSIRMGLTVCSFFDVFDEGHGLMRRRRAPLLHVLCRWCYAATHLAVLHARRQRLPVERPHAHADCRPGLGGGSLASGARSHLISSLNWRGRKRLNSRLRDAERCTDAACWQDVKAKPNPLHLDHGLCQ